ncbi:hypothetical protein Pelo_5845 [Pelomyxa schiedti]|nr:hypothetical protein Pelo_5845 [Pelomyxa schiedti]
MTTGDTRSLLQDVVAADTAAAIMGRGVSVVTHGNCWLTPLFKDIGVGGCVLQSVAVTCDSAASRLLGLKNSRVERSPRDLCHMFAGRAFTKALQLDPNPYGISGKAIGVGIVIFPIEEVKKTEIHVVIWVCLVLNLWIALTLFIGIILGYTILVTVTCQPKSVM